LLLDCAALSLLETLSDALLLLLELLPLTFAEPSPHFGPQPTMIATRIAAVTTAAIITRASRFFFKMAPLLRPQCNACSVCLTEQAH